MNVGDRFVPIANLIGPDVTAADLCADDLLSVVLKGYSFPTPCSGTAQRPPRRGR
jgi:hypothetical protein